MTIQPIGTGSAVLYITSADLKEQGLTPAQLTLEGALELARSAFSGAGLSMEGAIEIEAYPDACGVLVFARVTPPPRQWFSFPGFEELLCAVRALPAPCPESALAWLDGRFWLSLPGHERRLAACLSEFGRTEDAASHPDARLAEHGRPILEQDAPAVLLRHFSSCAPLFPSEPLTGMV